MANSKNATFVLGSLLGGFAVMCAWAYWDFQPDPLPQYISCMVAETGADCPPIKVR